VHDDGAAAAFARALGARAAAVGDDVVFGAGEYRPHTRAGERLLAHELEHVAHARRAGPPRPGIAPAASAAERSADAFAATLVPLHRLGPLGPVWQLQLQRVLDRGKIEDAAVLNEGPGHINEIDVRSGGTFEEADATKLTNTFSLEVEGPDVSSMKWLQFVSVEVYALVKGDRKHLRGTVPTPSGDAQLAGSATDRHWIVDSHQNPSPYYDAGFSYAATRTPTGLAMFDTPGQSAGTSFKGDLASRPAGTPHTLVMHLDTYLIQGTRAVYHVAWSATTSFARDAANNIASAQTVYHVDQSGPTTALPDALRKVLVAAYPAYAHVGQPPAAPPRRPRRPPRMPRPFLR